MHVHVACVYVCMYCTCVGVCGICIWAPPLDARQNSVKGIAFAKVGAEHPHPSIFLPSFYSTKKHCSGAFAARLQ